MAVTDHVSRDANLQSLKIGRQSSNIRENTGDRYISRTDRAEGVLVALRRLNNTTILFTVLIFVLLHIYFFSLLSLQFAMFTIMQRLAHREFAEELRQ